MTLTEIRNQVETFVTTNKGKLITRQEAYRSKHGRYWQGPLTPTVPPDDGALCTPDLTRGILRSTWGHVLKDANAWPAQWPMQAKVDTMRSPTGHGWTFTVFVTKGGKTYSRTWGFSEAADVQWAQVPDPPAPPVIPNEDLP